MLIAALLIGSAPSALMAQDAASGGPQRPDAERQASPTPAPAPARGSAGGGAGLDDETGDDIIVTGGRLPGAVLGDIQPEQQLSAADVRAYGVNSISDLVSELSPQTGGSPVILLNGKRISSFSEISDLPSEAIQRVDILPEQVALTYGYAPTQKVVNIVLRRRFRAELAQGRGGLSTDGGRESGSLNAAVMRIRGDNRFTLDVNYSRAADLLESQRGIIPTLPDNAIISDPDLITRYRTLSPATENASINATYARALGGVSASVNARIAVSDSDSLQGLPALRLLLPAGNPFTPFTVDTPVTRYLEDQAALAQQIKGTTAHLGVTLNGGLMPGWQWSFTGAADLSDTRTDTDRGFAPASAQALLNAGSTTFNPYGPIDPGLLSTRLSDNAKAQTRSVVGDLLLSGSLFKLPAGDVTTSIRLGASANSFDSRSVRSGVVGTNNYARQIGSGQVSLDLPLTSRREGVLGAVGDIGVNVNAGIQHLSDFGSLTTLGYGARWTPIEAIRVLVSANQDRAAPTGQQINDPLVTTPNVSVFDYARGETVFVTQLSGGNLNLRESVRDQFRLNVTIKPFKKPNLTLVANYVNSRTRNPIAAFPTPTPAIEAAFPDRFVRDADGALLSIDARPINFARAQSEQLRWGMDLSIPIKSRIQKKVEAWRDAGAKPDEMPQELKDMREAFAARAQRERARDGEGGPGRDGAAPPPPPPGGPGAGPGGPGGPGGGRGPGGFGGFGGGRGGGGAGGRIQFGLYHTWHLTESILIAPGVPQLNLLSGDATGSSGGQPRHEIEARAGYNNNGIGGRLSVNWESGTHVDGALGGLGNGTSRLNFGSLMTANLRLFANFGQMPALVKSAPFLRGAQVSIGIDNIFNERRSVTDATGAVPLRYQPGYLDPIGRQVSISFRKLFF